MTTTPPEKRILRRCPDCRLLFEAAAGTNACVVCGVPVDGLVLPIDAEAVPTEFAERETTHRLDVPRG